MSVDVRIPTILRTHTKGAKAVEGAGDTLADLFADLDTRYPGLRGRLITEEGALHRFVNVYINDEDVRFLGALEAKLSPGDTVTILPAVAGGSNHAARAGGLAHADRAARRDRLARSDRSDRVDLGEIPGDFSGLTANSS